MPRQTTTIFAALLALLCVLIGFVAGALFYESQISKSADASIWQTAGTVISAIGISAAISVAVFTELRITSRFKEQVDVQIALDKKADDRQQAEWDQRTIEKRIEQNRLNNQIQIGLINELEIILEETLDLASTCRETAALPFSISKYEFVRPIFDGLGTNVLTCERQVRMALVNYEGQYRNWLNRVSDAHDSYLQVEPSDRGATQQLKLHVASEADHFADTCAVYLVGLGWGRQNGQMNSPAVCERIEDVQRRIREEEY
jgi:hypothetical protein